MNNFSLRFVWEKLSGFVSCAKKRAAAAVMRAAQQHVDIETPRDYSEMATERRFLQHRHEKTHKNSQSFQQFQPFNVAVVSRASGKILIEKFSEAKYVRLMSFSIPDAQCKQLNRQSRVATVNFKIVKRFFPFLLRLRAHARVFDSESVSQYSLFSLKTGFADISHVVAHRLLKRARLVSLGANTFESFYFSRLAFRVNTQSEVDFSYYREVNFSLLLIFTFLTSRRRENICLCRARRFFSCKYASRVSRTKATKYWIGDRESVKVEKYVFLECEYLLSAENEIASFSSFREKCFLLFVGMSRVSRRHEASASLSMDMLF